MVYVSSIGSNPKRDIVKGMSINSETANTKQCETPLQLPNIITYHTDCCIFLKMQLIYTIYNANKVGLM